jgi:hypothetical protein
MSHTRIFYLNAHQLMVYLWNGSELDVQCLFDSTPEGQVAFAEYLAAEADIVSAMLVDVVEEEYRNETIPHVLGRDRRAVQNRKLAQQFRHTPYRTCQLQGREKTGRKDDRVLLTALTNPGMITSWLTHINAANVPLAGVYSVPMLGAQLLRKLKIGDSNTLLITEQSNGLLRQSFHGDGYLKISRLSPLTEDSKNNYTKFIVTEIERNQRYLNRLRILPFGKMLDVYVVCHHSRIEQLQQQCQDSEVIRYHIIDINEAARQVGLQQTITDNTSDSLFIRLLAGERPATNYASTQERRYHLMYQARKMMVAAGVVLALSSTAWSVKNVVDGMQYNSSRLGAREQVQRLEENQLQLSRYLPKTPVSPRDMQAAVETYRLLQAYGTSPYLTMSAVGKHLQQYPGLQLDAIQWISSLDANSSIAHLEAEAESDDMTFAEQQADIDESTRLYQISLFKGTVKPFYGNYPSAFILVNRFVDSLRKDSRFVEVTATAMPLDVNSRSTLKGVSGTTEQINPAKFEIKTVLRINPHFSLDRQVNLQRFGPMEGG